MLEPLGSGFLTGKYRRAGKSEEETRLQLAAVHELPRYWHERGFRILEELVRISGKIGKPPAHAALSWLLYYGCISSIIVGARNVNQLRDNLPVAEWDLDGMAKIRNSTNILIEADEGAYNRYDVMQFIKKGAADVILIKPAKAGGLYNAKKIVAIAEAAGLQCVIGTGWGLGIKVAAKLHLAASSIVRDAVEFSEIFLHDMFLASPYDASFAPPLKDGFLSVPQEPGFGIEDSAKEQVS